MNERTCRVCGCTDADCLQCFQAQGYPCWWITEDLCSRCAPKRIVVSNYPAYSLTSDGLCWSLWKDRKIGSQWRQMKLCPTKDGYLTIKLCSGNGASEVRYVHRLMLELFVGPDPGGYDACHCNGKRADNRVENLRWDTRKGNLKDRENHGTMNNGSRNGKSKLSESQVREIRSSIANGERTSDIAKRYGVKPPTICDIKSGRNWGGLK